MKKLLLLFAAVLFVQPLWGRPTDACPETGNATNGPEAPLNIFTNGPGKVYAFEIERDRHGRELIRQVQDGEMLPVGSHFALLAEPASGYQFSNWNQVTIYSLTTTIIDDLGGTPMTNYDTATEIEEWPPETNDVEPVLLQEVPPVKVIYSSISTNFSGISVTNSLLTVTEGWRANFAALPPKPPFRHRY
jgi:hypothetical protein